MSESNIIRPTVFLRLADLIIRTGRAKSSVWDALNPKSARHDPTFPKPIKSGNAGSRSTYWVEKEVEEWLQAQVQKSRVAKPVVSSAITRMVSARARAQGMSIDKNKRNARSPHADVRGKVSKRSVK